MDRDPVSAKHGATLLAVAAGVEGNGAVKEAENRLCGWKMFFERTGRDEGRRDRVSVWRKRGTDVGRHLCGDGMCDVHEAENANNSDHDGGVSGECFSGSSVYTGTEQRRDLSAGRTVFREVMAGYTHARSLR